jgi:hypothetical protein
LVVGKTNSHELPAPERLYVGSIEYVIESSAALAVFKDFREQQTLRSKTFEYVVTWEGRIRSPFEDELAFDTSTG